MLALGVVVAALALTSIDRRRDDELFAVVGAPPGFRRRLGAMQAWLLATVAAVVGTGLGLAGSAYGFWLYNRFERAVLPPIPFILPVGVAVLMTVGVPLAGAVGTWLLTADVRAVDLRRLDD